jgi:hypothetical protein
MEAVVPLNNIAYFAEYTTLSAFSADPPNQTELNQLISF